jgi:hypothetical protein
MSFFDILMHSRIARNGLTQIVELRSENLSLSFETISQLNLLYPVALHCMSP